VYSIGLSYRRTHHRTLPLAMLALGFAFIMGGHGWATGKTEAMIVPLGGLLIAAAHYVNYKYSGACSHDHKSYKLKS